MTEKQAAGLILMIHFDYLEESAYVMWLSQAEEAVRLHEPAICSTAKLHNSLKLKEPLYIWIRKYLEHGGFLRRCRCI